ncbi:MAG: amylo-alpha-1,6-glucosidase [Cellulomonas sp.]
MAVITFGTQVCTDLDEGSRREWLLADGRGGFAMGTVSGLRTRRYHGLLTIAQTPSRRFLAVAALDPVLVLSSGARVQLGVHEWADRTIVPSGHRHLERFDLIDGVPRWRWRVGDLVVEREIAMTHGVPGVTVSFRLVSGPDCELEVRALVTWRDSHDQRRGTGDLEVTHDRAGAVVADTYRLEGPSWEPDGRWYRRVFMREEAARGLADTEDLWSAGTFRARLTGTGDSLDVRGWAVDSPPPARTAIADSRVRARDLIRRASARSAVEEHLVLAADTFVIAGPDVIAGYPWFGTWSRDTMISFEGLFLETGRAEQGRDLLCAYGGRLSQGMLANTADTGAVEYNTVDATLWFVHAIDRYLQRTGDTDLMATAAGWLAQIVASHVRGTRYGIGVDRDGLLTQGQEHLALTWMDARIGSAAVTPRIGKPVEVNALWVNALAVTNQLLGRTGRSDPQFQALEVAARATFARRFESPSGAMLDVVDGPGGDDRAVRPYGLLAMSLPLGPGTAPMLAPLGQLLTPLGLRSLHPDDPAYRPHHVGDSVERDLAYHQGTVWPWLVGPYVDAALRAGPAPVDLLDALAAHLGEWGLGSVSETASGAPPHEATGAPFQAWSVAELLRAWRRLHIPGADGEEHR